MIVRHVKSKSGSDFDFTVELSCTPLLDVLEVIGPNMASNLVPPPCRGGRVVTSGKPER